MSSQNSSEDWMKSAQYLRNLGQIPDRCSMVIYGDSLVAGYLIDVLRNERPDVSVECIVTTSKEGTFKGIRMIKVEEFNRNRFSFDMLVIAPLVWISDILQAIEGVPSKAIYINAIVDCTSLNTGYRSDGFEPNDLGASEVLDMLYDEESREEWAVVTRAMRLRDVTECIERFHKRRAGEVHYLEYSGLGRGDTVIEGGIWDGETTKNFSERIGPEGKIYAFEPLGSRYLDSAFSKISSIELIPKALWSRNARLKFVDRGGITVTEELTGSDLDEEFVDAVTIDDFVNTRNIKKVDYIKLDVEGAEPDVLEGAVNTISRLRPTLAISIYHTRDQYFSIPLKMREQLKDYVFILRCYSPAAVEVVLYACPVERLDNRFHSALRPMA